MKIPFWNVVIALAFLTGSSPANSHGIAGNRYFDGTLTFDDPAVADEAILPNYSNSIGFRAQLLFFLDDLLPSLFGKPMLSDQPNRSQIAWH